MMNNNIFYFYITAVINALLLYNMMLTESETYLGVSDLVKFSIFAITPINKDFSQRKCFLLNT